MAHFPDDVAADAGMKGIIGGVGLRGILRYTRLVFWILPTVLALLLASRPLSSQPTFKSYLRFWHAATSPMRGRS